MQFSLKNYNPSVLITAILLLAYGFDVLFVNIIEPILVEHFPGVSIVRAPSNSALIGLFLAIHNKYLWHLRVFKLLVNVPDMRGRYSGNIRFVWGGNHGCKDCKIEVAQTASTISVRCYFDNEVGERTSSKSLVEEIHKEDGFYHIYLFYLNSGTVENDTLDCHEGANAFKYIPATKDRKAKLTGHYFTNRQTQTRGIIEGEFETKTLKAEF